jgi:hypothetical protein
LRLALKSLALYALLVGVPFAALGAILRAGAGLRAPAAIAGAWRVEVAGLPLDPAGAAAFRTLSVTQSGIHLSVALAGRELRGSLGGDTLAAASGGVRFTPPACFRGELDLRARVDTTARPLRMAGTLGAPGTGCARLPFTAVREAPAGRGAR